MSISISIAKNIMNGLHTKYWQWLHFLISLFTILYILQTSFVNSPLSGAIILVAFFLADVEVGIGTILGGSVATVSEMVGI